MKVSLPGGSGHATVSHGSYNRTKDTPMAVSLPAVALPPTAAPEPPKKMCSMPGEFTTKRTLSQTSFPTSDNSSSTCYVLHDVVLAGLAVGVQAQSDAGTDTSGGRCAHNERASD